MDKISFSQQIFRPGLIVLISVFFGCDSSDNVGVNVELESGASVLFEEISLPARNVYIDSLRTDGEGSILIGKYTDPLMGEVQTEGYFQMAFNQGPLPRTGGGADTLQLDSVYLELDQVDFVSNSASPTIDIDVSELEDDLTRDVVYVSTTQQNTSTLAASYSSTFEAERDTIIRLKMEDSFGLKLFGQLAEIADDDERTTSSEEFAALGIRARSTNDILFNIDLASSNTNSRLVLYTSPVAAERDTTYEISFRFSTESVSNEILAKYTYIDRSAANLSAVNDKASFTIAGEHLVLDPIYGGHAAIDLDPLKTFFASNDNILINNATILLDTAFNERSLLANFRFYFDKNSGFFAPGILVNPFDNIIMSDVGYLQRQSDPAISTLKSDSSALEVTPTLFTQNLYNNFKLIGDLTLRNLDAEEPRSINELFLVSPRSITLQRALLKKDGIKIRIFYTEVN